MDRTDIEDTIRHLNSIIPDPDERMSETAIYLMVKLVERAISATESGIIKALDERGIRTRNRG